MADTSGENIFVVSVGSTLLVKRLSFDALSGTLSLISANPAYPVRVITGADLEAVKVEGRVIDCVCTGFEQGGESRYKAVEGGGGQFFLGVVFEKTSAIPI